MVFRFGGTVFSKGDKRVCDTMAEEMGAPERRLERGEEL